MKEKFIVEVDRNFKYIESDYFIPVYYSSKLGLKYRLEFKDNSIDYNFAEFDKYVIDTIKNVDSDKVDSIYSNYQKYFAGNRPSSFKAGKIPEISDLKDIIDKSVDRF